MNFDFYQQYKDYSNIDLLKIVKKPADYQPEAVAIATRILSERQVTDEEIRLVDQYFQEIKNSAIAEKERADALKKKATDFLEPVLHPGETIETGKWLNILLVIIALQYIWTLFNTVKLLIGFLQCNSCSLDLYLLAELLPLLYIPVIFYLLFKRRRWGWILLFADNLFILISGASQIYIFFKYQDIHHGDTASFLLPIFIRAAFAFFLWREPFANHFSVTYETKKKTALITTAGALFFIFVMNFLFGT